MYVRVLVMRPDADEHADIVEQGRDLQPEAVAASERVLGGEVIEEARRQVGHGPRMRRVVAVLLPERLGAGQHLGAEVGQHRLGRGAGHGHEQPGSQRDVGHQQPRRSRLEHQSAR